jgi:hypothetical protein
VRGSGAVRRATRSGDRASFSTCRPCRRRRPASPGRPLGLRLLRNHRLAVQKPSFTWLPLN